MNINDRYMVKQRFSLLIQITDAVTEETKEFSEKFEKGLDKRTDLWYNIWVKQSRASHSHLYTSVLRVEYGKCGYTVCACVEDSVFHTFFCRYNRITEVFRYQH